MRPTSEHENIDVAKENRGGEILWETGLRFMPQASEGLVQPRGKKADVGSQIWCQAANAKECHFLIFFLVFGLFVLTCICSEEKEKELMGEILKHILFFHESEQFK